MVIVPTPGSIWDYPYLNQVTSMMGLVYGTGPEPEQDFFPPKTRIPDTHMESPSRYDLTKSEARSLDETELGEVKTTLPTSNVATSTQSSQPGSIPCRNGGDNAATENATISESTRKEAIEDKKENALTADNRSVAIGLSTFDNPGPSRVQPSKKNAIRGNTKTTQEKSTQMRQNSSSQRLQGNEDVDDDV
ncbi:hypothetical protein WN55_09425, partial [Dufourea novaeangliae]